MKRIVRRAAALVLAILMFAALAAAVKRAPKRIAPPALPGAGLDARQDALIRAGIVALTAGKLASYCALAQRVEAAGRFRAALPDDRYLQAAQRGGDTPFAYTLPDERSPRQPVAIVFAPRFFAETTPPARAALLLHELAHWQAFQRSGRSDEYDGYKAEFDARSALGLTDRDGLTYFMLLDGVAQYVVPRAPAYGNDPAVKEYIREAGK